MGKNAVSALRSQLRAQISDAYRAESDLKHLAQSILNAMNDRVGCGARQSLASIHNHFSDCMDMGLKSAEQAARGLEAGYTAADALAAQAKDLLAQAQNIVTGLGNL